MLVGGGTVAVLVGSGVSVGLGFVGVGVTDGPGVSEIAGVSVCAGVGVSVSKGGFVGFCLGG